MRGTPFGFSGWHLGLNTIDSPFTLVEGETRECLNVISSERGAIKKRTGSTLFTTTAFPNLAATDTFKRAAEKPLSNGGKWTVLHEFEDTGEINGTEHWQVTKAKTASGGYWNVAEQTNPAVSVELFQHGKESLGNTSVFACVQTGAALSAYEVRLFKFGALESYAVKIILWNAGSKTTLAEFSSSTFNSGDSIGISVRGGSVKAWRKSAGTWLVLTEAKDTTWTQGFGGIGSNDGFTRYNNFAIGEYGSASIREFNGLASVKTAGGRFLIASSGKNLYSINESGESTAIGEGFTEGKQWSIIQFNKGKEVVGGPVYLQNGTDAPQVWTGTEKATKVEEWKSKESAELEFGEGKEETIATPKGKYMVAHLNRIFIANIEGNGSLVRCSSINTAQESDPSIWPKKFFLEFDPNDGTEITGLGSVGPYVLVFKPYKCWIIHSAAPLASRQLSENTGCVSHRSITETPVGTFFLTADQGIYVTNGSRLTEMSYKVRPTILAINPAKQELAAGAFFNNHYYLSFPSEGSAVSNRTLDYDVALKSWWLHDIAGAQWATSEIGTKAGEPTILYLVKPEASGGVARAFVPGVYSDTIEGAAKTYVGSESLGLGTYWLSPWEPFYYFIFRHRIKAPFIKKRLRQFFFDGSGTVVPFQFKNFKTNKEEIKAVLNNEAMSEPKSPVKFGAEAGRARAYSLGTANEVSFAFGNNETQPFEVTFCAYMAQFRKS